jgi:phage-related protein
MGKKDRDKNEPAEPIDSAQLFRVRPLRQARREAETGNGLFQNDREKLWVTNQLRLLHHWPLDRKQQDQFGTDLDFSKVTHRNESFYELRLDDEHLHQNNLRVFFWVHDERKTIWIIHGFWKKTNRLDEAVKTLVARRIKSLKGGIQDGSIE